jgi:type IV pilus assembly protein PilE
MTDNRQIAKQRGVTLVELMIAVAVIAILSGIAYPSYAAHVRKSQRAAAQSFLMDVAMRQQQRMVDVRGFAASIADLGMAAPDNVDARYTLAVAAVAGPPPGFTLTATPKGAQVGDSCGVLSVTNAGVRSPANCW